MTAGFAAAIACLVAMVIGTLWLEGVRDEQARLVHRTQETLLVLHDIRGLFRAAATSLHAIVGDGPEWERELSLAVGEELEPAMARLGSLVAGDGVQLARYQRLRPHVAQLGQRSRAALLALRRGETDRARSLLEGVGPAALASVDVVISEMERSEQARLADQQRRWRGASVLGVLAFGAAAVLLLVLIMLAARLVRAESAERELVSAHRAEVVAVQQRIMAIVGHDLRNPLASLKTSAELLSRSPGLPEGRREEVRRILTSARRMERLLHDLVDFSRLRAGRSLALERAPLDLAEACRQAVAGLGREAEARVEVESRGDATGQWDAGRIEQVVANLVSNAIKYGPQDRPVRVLVEGRPGEVALSVHDEGGGLAPELRQAVFEPFQRGRAGDTHAASSSGLGLFIVRQIAEAHGGTAEVVSEPGLGTTFTVRLPRPPDPPAASAGAGG